MIGPAGTKPPVSEAIRIPRHPLSPVRSARRSARPAGSFATKPAVTGDGDPRNDRDEALERNLEAKAHGAATPAQRHQAEHESEAQRMKVELVVTACSSRPGGRAASIGSTMATTGNSREINPATSGRGAKPGSARRRTPPPSGGAPTPECAGGRGRPRRQVGDERAASHCRPRAGPSRNDVIGPPGVTIPAKLASVMPLSPERSPISGRPCRAAGAPG